MINMIIRVKVKPGSKEEKLEQVSDGMYVANIREQAREGKANYALIKLIAKKFDVSSRDVVIKTPLSRNKVVEIIEK